MSADLQRAKSMGKALRGAMIVALGLFLVGVAILAAFG